MTSKIYKPYINGNTKRPGTHQYHYLGPTVAVVAEKLDLTVGQLCFRCNFQTVRNLKKGTKEMSSEGPKMVERSYGLAGNGLKWPKNQEISSDPWWPQPASPGRSGRVRRRPAVKFHRHDRLDVLLPPVRRMYSKSGRNRLLWLKLERPANGSK